MKMMVTHNMVIVHPNDIPPNGVCKGCILGKHHWAPFDLGKAWCAHDRLDLVHTDLCCMNKPSLVGAKYILAFIDDFSQFKWVYFLKNKVQVFERFKEVRALAEKQCGRPIKCLRSENGGEYVSQQFEIYFL